MNPSAPCKVNPDSGIQEFFSCGIRNSKLKESEIPLKIGIRRNPYLESGIYTAESRINKTVLNYLTWCETLFLYVDYVTKSVK